MSGETPTADLDSRRGLQNVLDGNGMHLVVDREAVMITVQFVGFLNVEGEKSPLDVPVLNPWEEG
jgi:hypothetical protein